MLRLFKKAAGLLGLLPLALLAAPAPDRAFQAILDADAAQLSQFLPEGGSPNARSGRGNTLLMYAAAFGTLDAVKTLLAQGADPNLKNGFDATALMWCASDAAKLKLLLAKGADPNARSKSGRTALLLAALQPSPQPFDVLIAHGADPFTTDTFGYTILSAGATSGNQSAVRLGLKKHLDINARTKPGNTALTSAVSLGSVEFTKRLLDAGADPNNITSTIGPRVQNGTVLTSSFTPLIYAAPYSSPAITKLLLDHGASVKPVDGRGMTALHAAVASETAHPETVRLLLAHGADPDFQNSRGESARDWARKYPRPEVLALLNIPTPPALPAELAAEPAVAAQPTLAPAAAYAKSMALLNQVSSGFVQKGGCVACHAQNAAGLAAAAGKANGLDPEPASARERLKVTRLNWAARAEGLLLREDGPGAAANTVSSLLGMAADGYQPDFVTSAMLRNCAMQQSPQGYWRRLLAVSRVPSEDTELALTAEVVHALHQFSTGGNREEYARRIARARKWLLTAKPAYTADANWLVLGLKWSGASPAQVAKAARAVSQAQRPSGGWGQQGFLPEDAYATGQALYALHEAGMAPTDPVFRKGIAYLLRTQASDGSWHVRSRAVKFQPYFQSGFPYDHDQWISMSGTTWAAVALALSAGAEPKPSLLAAAR